MGNIKSIKKINKEEQNETQKEEEKKILIHCISYYIIH